jgi:hypothetical protein
MTHPMLSLAVVAVARLVITGLLLALLATVARRR